MPSNAQPKTLGSKNQNKQPTAKNLSRPSNAKENNPALSHTDTMGPPDIVSSKNFTGKNPQTTASANLAESRPVQDNTDEVSGGVGVNKKKQKRRQKEAARKAAEQALDLSVPHAEHSTNLADPPYQDIKKGTAVNQPTGVPNGYHHGVSGFDDQEQYEPEEEEAIYYREGSHQQYQDPYDPRINGHNVHDYITQDALGGKAKKKKKAKANSGFQDAYSMDNPSLATQKTYQPPPISQPPPLNQHDPPGTRRPMQNDLKDRIWNTSTAEERERIKEFWLSLGEEDRRSLVKVEKEAVLKKMKEQQKHSCSCTVCGRKRTAIEEELEILYDAYYEELEVMPGNPPPQMHNGRSSRGRIQELGDDDEVGDEEDYSDDEDNEDISDDEIDDQAAHTIPSGRTDFFNFGKSLTVQGGILTVADDLLKNDGKKFIEMMEQLAERRMQREEDQYARAGLGHPPSTGHSHSQSADDDGYDDEEEEEEEYDEDDEEFDEEDEMEQMTEMERMKEGRRMFQIFAARMFEQRVLTAYREKVALERQKKLLEELDDESRIDAQREAKKAKEAQKKKDKKRLQKEAKDAEKAKKEAEKAAEEAAAKALEEKKAEEVRQRKEEQRKKKETEKKAQEEEKRRKDVEKQKRLQEAKEQQAELERKQRDQKEREKKKREEVKRKEREEREAKEKEVEEKKERDATERREREAKAKAENEAKERAKQDAQLTHRKTSHANAPPTPMPPGLHPPVTTSSHTSPRLQIATPVVPKAPTPVRPRQPSLQGLHNISPKALQPASSSAATSPSVSSGPQNGLPEKSTVQPIPTHPVQPSNRYSPASISPGQPIPPPGLPNMQPMPGNPYPSTFAPPLSPTMQQVPQNPAFYPSQPPIGSGPYRGFAAPNGMPYSPVSSGPGQILGGRGSTIAPSLPHLSTGGPPNANANDVNRYGMSRDNVPSQTHSRNTSASFDRSSLDTPNIAAQSQPIARPAPIKRPSSVTPYHQSEQTRSRNADVDDLSNHLGSSALLDDTDAPFHPQMDDSHRGSIAPGAPRTIGQGFGANPGFSNPIGTTRMDNFPRGIQTGNGKPWHVQASPFGVPTMPGAPQWSNPPGFGRTNHGSGFGSIGGSNRLTGSRAVTLRVLVRKACEKLTAQSPINQNLGWHHANDVLREVQMMKSTNEASVHMAEMLEICDTEGNGQNGGGTFMTRTDDQVGLLIRFDSGQNVLMGGRGAGDIGSPIIGGSAIPAIGGQRSFQQPGGF